ncbi:hypothetical protein EDC01DRAFT_672288 [Geopyxis carbonaria]|nr:hypothetical protein EDC01DRAFT_672288 [Geopyxis carbonaria]
MITSTTHGTTSFATTFAAPVPMIPANTEITTGFTSFLKKLFAFLLSLPAFLTYLTIRLRCAFGSLFHTILPSFDFLVFFSSSLRIRPLIPRSSRSRGVSESTSGSGMARMDASCASSVGVSGETSSSSSSGVRSRSATAASGMSSASKEKSARARGRCGFSMPDSIRRSSTTAAAGSASALTALALSAKSANATAENFMAACLEKVEVE